MKVADLIHSRTDIFSIPEETTVQEAACYLREKQVRAVGVRNPQGKVVGVVSQSDVSDKVAAENKCPAWVRAREIMSTKLVTVSPELPLEECLRLMEKHSIYHLLVIGEKGEYRGMISVQDLLAVIASDQKARADMLEDFMFPKR
jgi:CBS domain-containing protein